MAREICFPKSFYVEKSLSAFFEQLQCLVCSAALLEISSRGKT